MNDPADVSNLSLPSEVEPAEGQAGPPFGPASLYISAVSAVQVVLGLGLQVVLGYMFGARQQMDEYLVAVAIPQLVQVVVGPALTVSLAPCWAGWKREGVEQEASGAALLVVLGIASIIAGVTAALSSRLPTILAPGLVRHGDPLLATNLTRALAMAIVPQTVVAYLTATAIARRRYLLWPVAGVIGVGVLLGLTWTCAPRFGITALAGAYLASAVVQLLLLAVYLPGRPHAWRGGFVHLRSLANTSLPVTLKNLVTRFTTVSDRWIASWIGVGAISQVVYGSRLAQTFATVLSTGLGTTVLADLSALAGSRAKRLETSIADGVRVMAFLALPIAAVLFLWAEPIILLVYGRGAFTMSDVIATAHVLRCASGWFAAGSVGVPVIMGLFALNQHRIVSLISVVTAVLNLGLSYLLSRVVGVWGIPLAFSVTATLNLAAFVVVLRNLRGSVVFRPWHSIRDPNLISLLGLTGALLTLQPSGSHPHPLSYPEILVVLGRLAVAGAIYLGIAGALRSPELHSVIDAFRGILRHARRVAKRDRSPRDEGP